MNITFHFIWFQILPMQYILILIINYTDFTSVYGQKQKKKKGILKLNFNVCKIAERNFIGQEGRG